MFPISGEARGAEGRMGGRALPRRWVSIGRACRMLGVDASTLRRWADAGAVRVFVTPGGHRRYAEEDLWRLVRPAQSSDDAVGELVSAIVARYHATTNQGGLRGRPWLHRCDDGVLLRCQALGWRLLARLAAYVEAQRQAERDRLLAEARAVGAAFGAEARRAGLSPVEVLEAFCLCRGPVLEGVARWMRCHPLLTAWASDVALHVGRFLDEVQLAALRVLAGMARLPSSAPVTPSGPTEDRASLDGEGSRLDCPPSAERSLRAARGPA